MKHHTVVPKFTDDFIKRTVIKNGEDTTIITKGDHIPLYIDTKWERFVSAEIWNTDQDRLCEFMREAGPGYSYSNPRAFAMSLYRSRFQRHNIGIDTDGYCGVMSRRALYGGRCEVLEFQDTYAYMYDINASYPFSSTKCEFPDTSELEYVEPSLENIRTFPGIAEVEFSQDGYVPVLPMRHEGRTIYAQCNHKIGVYTHNELLYALSCGVEIHAVLKQYVSKPLTHNPFTEFVEYCYERRIKGGSKLWKRVANSLFGRLAMVNSRAMLIKFKPVRNFEIVKDLPNHLRGFFGVCCVGNEVSSSVISNPMWAAIVLAEARNRLHKLAVVKHALYMDTDAIITKEQFDVSGADVMGELKVKEGHFNIRGVKQYLYTPQFGNPEIVLKGINKKHRTVQDVIQSAYTQERIRHEDGSTVPYVL